MLDLGIAGRRAIVCASSRGLGKACARALARAGVAVVVNGLDEARLEATAAELARETGAEITAVAADVTTRDGPGEAARGPARSGHPGDQRGRAAVQGLPRARRARRS